eukprot:TRINITY_DN51234_c0_g1_i1.p1 TRINITY_DN51234_c0_g1~~TRINITY_DN51234_c0_g1_i1.p1  ORF type:complete len:477 (+),score=139.15 TRINITY_DN51234_c0_g1_i1:78-1433(+)
MQGPIATPSPPPPPQRPPASALLRLRHVPENTLTDFRNHVVQSLRPATGGSRRPASARQYAVLADALPMGGREALQRGCPPGVELIFFRSVSVPRGVSPRAPRFVPDPVKRPPRMPRARAGLRRPQTARTAADGRWVAKAIGDVDALLQQRDEEHPHDPGTWWPLRAKAEAEGTVDDHATVLREVPQDVSLQRHHLLLVLHAAQRLQAACTGLSAASAEHAVRACARAGHAVPGAAAAPLTLKSFCSHVQALGCPTPHFDDAGLGRPAPSWEDLFRSFDRGLGKVDPSMLQHAFVFAAAAPHRRPCGLLRLFLCSLRDPDRSCFVLEMHALAGMYEAAAAECARLESSRASSRTQSWACRGAPPRLQPQHATVLQELRQLFATVPLTGGEVGSAGLLHHIRSHGPSLAAEAKAMPELRAALDYLDRRQSHFVPPTPPKPSEEGDRQAGGDD